MKAGRMPVVVVVKKGEMLKQFLPRCVFVRVVNVYCQACGDEIELGVRYDIANNFPEICPNCGQKLWWAKECEQSEKM